MEQKFTTLAQDALSDAVQSAAAAGNAQVDTLHLADALLRQEQGVVRALIAQAGADAQQIGAEIRNALVHCLHLLAQLQLSQMQVVSFWLR